MFRFLQRFGRDAQARWRAPGWTTRVRRRNHQLNCEALESRQLLSVYYIVNASSGKVLTDPAFSASYGTPIAQYQLYGTVNQQWTLGPAERTGYETIFNASSDLALTGSVAATSNGTGITQSQVSEGPSQRWQIDKLGDGNVEIVNPYSHLMLNDPGSSTSNGTQIIQTTYVGLQDQWTLLAAGSAVSPNSYDYIVNEAFAQLLDVASPTNGPTSAAYLSPVTVSAADQTVMWTLVPLADGYTVIVNSASGQVLAQGGTIYNYPSATDLPLNGALNEQWGFSGQGTYISIVNASSGLVLAAPEYPISVFMLPWNGAQYEQWGLDPIRQT